ncbi:MAG: NAD(P)-dependent oxidoreductase [Candidatus Saccharibacteria bacterium]|nr:NAD(P)-dependent oxidoreductase [Candidatus Saccharibacteria bacterium]
MKAFIFDPLWDELVTEDLLAKLSSENIEIIVTKDKLALSDCKVLYEGDDERILCINPDYVDWNLKEEDYKDIPNLKAILGAATSYQWIESSFADKNNIPICNVRNFSTQAVAEWAVTMMLNLARRIPLLIKEDFPLDFDKDFMKYRGIELKGKTVGIVGMGHIGEAIAERCAGLGMSVRYWSENTKSDRYEYCDLEKLVSESDVIFPAMAINDDTKKVLSNDLLATLKGQAILVSIVHGLFDENFILEQVKSGQLFGFGFEAEPKSFRKYEGNVWAAPAYAWTTKESMNNSMEKWVENMVNAARGSFLNRVN